MLARHNIQIHVCQPGRAVTDYQASISMPTALCIGEDASRCMKQVGYSCERHGVPLLLSASA